MESDEAYSWRGERRAKLLVNNVQALNRRQLYPGSAPVRVEVKATSDASSVACGAHMKLGSKLHVAHMNLATEQKERSSFDEQKKYRKGIIGTKVFSDPKDLLELGDYDDSLLGSSGFNSPLLAIKISF